MNAKLRETVSHVLAMSIVVLNLRKIQRAFLRLWLDFLCRFAADEMLVFVQVTL